MQARGERTLAQTLMPSMNPRFFISGVVTTFYDIIEMTGLICRVSTPEIKNRGFPHMVEFARAWMHGCGIRCSHKFIVCVWAVSVVVLPDERRRLAEVFSDDDSAASRGDLDSWKERWL